MDPKTEYVQRRLAEIGVDRDDVVLRSLLAEIYDLRNRTIETPSIKTIGSHYLDRAIGFLQDTRKALNELPE